MTQASLEDPYRSITLHWQLIKFQDELWQDQTVSKP
jgi:hypothetical protein